MPPSNLNESLVRQSILAWRFSPVVILNILCHSLWSAEFLLQSQLMALWESLVCNLLLSPCCFKISLLSFNYCHFSYDISWCSPLWVDPVWNSVLPELACLFSFQVRKAFSCYVFEYVWGPFVSFSSFWDPYYVNISLLVVLEVSTVALISFHSFFPVTCWWISTSLSSSLLIYHSVSFSLLIPSG